MTGHVSADPSPDDAALRRPAHTRARIGKRRKRIDAPFVDAAMRAVRIYPAADAGESWIIDKLAGYPSVRRRPSCSLAIRPRHLSTCTTAFYGAAMHGCSHREWMAARREHILCPPAGQSRAKSANLS
jgi:hypothetical protein